MSDNTIVSKYTKPKYIYSDKSLSEPLMINNANNINIEKSTKTLETRIEASEGNVLNVNKPEPQMKLTKNMIRRMFIKIVKNSGSYIISTLSVFLIQTVALIFLGHSDSGLFNINAAQIGNVFINISGYSLALSSINAFDTLGSQAYGKRDLDMFYKLFNDAKIFSVILFLIFVFPICFIAIYILRSLNISEDFAVASSLYIKISLIAVFCNLLNAIHIKFLQIIGKSVLVMWVNIVALCVNIIACMSFIYTFKLGVTGAAISVAISSVFGLILTSFYVYRFNPCNNKNILDFNTEALAYSQFYYYTKLAFSSGILGFLKELPFDLIVFSSYYLDNISFTSNTILYNYTTLLFYILIGFNVPLTQKVGYYIGKYNLNKYAVFIKNTFILAAILLTIINIIQFIFRYQIAYIFVNNEQVSENVVYFLNFYIFIIYFDWSNNILNSILKGLNKHYEVNVLCSLLLLFIFVPLGLLLSFSLKFGFIGFWFSLFVSMVIFCAMQLYYLNSLDVQDQSIKIANELRALVEEEDILFR